ncbi:hypothetical protein VSWAT3_00668 [uncultured phage MedDCM-OCT-S05-C113]|nr:hypothetical protein VSWAT3_00668 [uncultured phage MedDCM-OCT-S05-C113]
MKKNVDGVRIEMTDAEIAERQAEEKAFADDKPNRQKNALRQTRNPLLKEADHKINTLIDNGGDASAWRKYRQDLRDITKASDLDNVTFPTKPS